MGWIKDAYEEGVQDGEEQATLTIAILKGFKWVWYKCIGLYLMIPYLIGALFYALSIVGFSRAKELLEIAMGILKYPEHVWEMVDIKTNYKSAPIANGIWRCTFGLLTSLGYIFFGIVSFLSIILISEGKVCFKMLKVGFTPFGATVEKIEE